MRSMIKYIFITQTLYFFLFQICDGATEWISITSDGFEGPGSTKYGNWKRGGSDAAVVGNNSHSGNRAARIKNGTTPQKATLFHKNNHDVTLFDTLRINFWYKSKSFEAQHNDKFYLEYSSNGGNTWNSVETWTIGEDFENNVYKEESVILDRSIFEFTEKARLRFRCSGNQGNDRIYLDDIEFEGSINASPDPIQEPTLSPTPAPSNSPTTSPTPAPSKSSPTTPTGHPSTDCKSFTFDLTTDGFGYEVTFTLADASNGIIRLRGGGYDSSNSYQETVCLIDGRYIFTISDSHGDGICCSDGNGNYSISLDGNLLKAGDDFGSEEQTVLDVGPPGPSSSPTPASTCRSDGVSCLLGDQCCSGRCRSYICSDSS
jgi:hypothetical protein